MTVLIYIFIVMAILMGMFCMFVIARDVVLEEKERRQKAKKDERPTSVETAKETVKETETTENVEKTEEEECASVEEKPTAEQETATASVSANEETTTTAVNDDLAVAFSTATQTLEEKYLALSAEYRGYYDEIVKYAMSVENSKRYKNGSYEEYKVGKSRLVRLKIKRGVVVSELVIPNLTFKTYVADNKVAMKQAPATIKVVDEASLTAVKDSIGIAVRAIEEERAYKKEQAKLRRKQKRAEAREVANAKTE